MQKIFKLFILLSLFFSNADGQIHEIRKMEEIVPFVEESTWVLFDIDDTLIHTQTMLGSNQWEDFLKKHMKGNRSADIVPMMWFTLRTVPFDPLEERIAKLVLDLQNKSNVFTLGLTARHPISTSPEFPEINLTIQQLNRVGIYLGASDEINVFSNEQCIEKGVIFCSGKQKGPFLKDLIERIGYEPKRVVFVDDKLYHVKSVDQSMSDAGIQCESFWYRKIEETFEGFDPLIGVIQFEHYLRTQILLSDKEADALRDNYSDILPQEYLLDLLDYYDPLSKLELAL